MTRIAECDDYVNAIQVPQLIKSQKLKGGAPEMNGIRPVMYTGGFCVVFPFTAQKKYAVRCWHAHLDGAQDRTSKIASYLSKVNLPYFVDFQYDDEGLATPKGIMPIVIMDWVEAKSLKAYLEEHLYQPDVLNRLAEAFLKMAEELHSHQLSHGDLQHGNIMIKSNGDIVLVDYDSMYVPELKGYTSQICGLRGYQHPARWKEKLVSPKADYFSELIIYTSIRALEKYPELWDELQIKDTDTLVFSGEDLDSHGKASIFSRLSRDPYLSELVRAIQDALNRDSIDLLSPLEQVEPNRARLHEKEDLFSWISGQLKELEDSPVSSDLKTWLEKWDDYSIEEIKAKATFICNAVKEYKEKKARAESVKGLSQEWKDNGYSPTPPRIDTGSDLKDMREEWSAQSPTSPSGPSYKSSEVEETRKQW